MATKQTPAEIAEFQKNLEAMRATDEQRLAAREKGQSTKEYDGKIADLNSKMEVYDKWLRHDKANLTANEVETLTIGGDASGGYAAPQEMVNEFERDLMEHSPLRKLACLRTTSAKSLAIPKKTGEVAAVWAGEIEQRGTESDAIGLGMEVLEVNELRAWAYVSCKMLEDAHFNVRHEILFEYVQQFSRAENDAFMNGDGVRKPEGILTNKNIESINSGSATGVTFEGLMKLIHSVKTGCHTEFYILLNRTTLGKIRLLKDGAGQYIVQPRFPNMIAGHKFMEMPNMPDIAANSTPILFGDFKRGYAVTDGTSMIITRYPCTRQQARQVLFVGMRRVGGQVTRAETMKKLVIKA